MIISQWCLSQICHQKTAKLVTLKMSMLSYAKSSSNVIYYFCCVPKLHRIPYWLKGGEGVNLNFSPANSPTTILAVAYCRGWSKNQKNGPISPACSNRCSSPFARPATRATGPISGPFVPPSVEWGERPSPSASTSDLVPPSLR